VLSCTVITKKLENHGCFVISLGISYANVSLTARLV
jgi:hypothetical protein